MSRKYYGRATLRKRKYKVDEPGDHWEHHRGRPTFESIDEGGDEPFHIPGRKLKVIHEGPHIEIEHQRGTYDDPHQHASVSAVIRDENGKVLERIGGVQAREDGALPERVREALERRRIRIPEGMHFYQETAGEQTPYQKAMKKWEDAIERKRYGIANYEKAIAEMGKRKRVNWKNHVVGMIKGYWFGTLKKTLTHPITTLSNHPRFQKQRMLKRLAKEEKEYRGMLERASEYFTLASDRHTRELKFIHDPEKEIKFMEELKNKPKKKLKEETAHMETEGLNY